MAALGNILQGKIFSIRNLLMFVTIVLMVIVIPMTVFQMTSAWDKREQAQRSMEVNSLIDDIVQLKMALGDERTATNTAYGFAGSVDPFLVNKIAGSRRAAEAAYDNVIAKLADLPEFDGKEFNEEIYNSVAARFGEHKAKLIKDYKEYRGMQAQIDADLANPSQAQLRSRDIVKVLTEAIDSAALLRSDLEENYDFGDDRISQVIRLKRQLWLMIEYATRESSSLGENVASGRQISDIQRETGSKYGGYGEASWDIVKAIANSSAIAREGTTEESRKKQLADIQNTFFLDFADTRFGLYDLSDSAEPDENGVTVVDYEISAADWVKTADAAAAPVLKMADYAGDLSRELNEAAVASSTANVVLAFILLGVVLVAGALSFWVVLVRVVKPVNALSETMMVLANGNLEVDVPSTESQDEVGDMARSVQIFKENAIERQRLEAEQREREEAERLRQEEEERRQREAEEARRLREEEQEAQAREERRQAMLDLADQFEASVLAVVESVSKSAQEMERAARGMAETADDTTQKSQVVANAAQQASSNAQMVASAAEQLSASVREITGQTNQSSAAARDAVSRTENAGRDVAQLVDAAQKIGDVVKLINDIAEQTNLLALNATIEAARAGDAGKGFAVVASEVKSLANQTARATQEISDQVEGMQQATNLAVRAMDQIKAIIGDIESTSVSIASAVEEQDASTQEIARNVAEVSSGTEEVTSIIHDVNEGATSTGSAATQVLSAAQLLTQQSDDLRGQVEGFLATIRS